MFFKAFGIRIALYFGMEQPKVEISVRIFSDILSDLRNQREIWGILRLNEYLSAEHPLRKAAISQIKKSLYKKPIPPQTISKIVDGYRLSELSSLERSQILAFNEAPRSISKRIPFPKRLMSSSKQKKVRVRHPLRRTQHNIAAHL
ncbi:MAG: hypothetical protein D6808_01130 [Candidatus Dadabacteria bacterium]|nr:MAG: hypothetical protein D6808_01130 [Candidatus Dadabacteria bacterium]